MIDRFRQRSGRVVSVGRLALAAIFLLALLLGDEVPRGDGLNAFSVTAIYICWSAFLVGATWRDWWLDFSLAAPAHVVDIFVFGAIVFLTEGYTSPFYAFSVFLILAATIRWSWRQTGVTAAAAVAVFLLAGLLASMSAHLPLEPDRVLWRATYLVVLSLLLIWFGITQQRDGPVPQPEEYGEDASPHPPAGEALSYALACIPADVAILVWWDPEEPWVHVWETDGGGLSRERLGPEELPGALESTQDHAPILFDLKRNRSLVRPERGRASTGGLPPLLLANRVRQRGYSQGLAVNIRSAYFAGELILAGRDGLGVDHLDQASEVSAQIAGLFDRYSVLNVSAQKAVDQAKATLARDLHDGVVQVLSGISFRLEALRSWCAAGRSPEDEISGIQRAIAAEQLNVRRFIAHLQYGRGSSRLIDLNASLRELIDQLCSHWKIDCELVAEDSSIMVPAWMEHSIKQLIREATANAVRHGQAKTVECKVARSDGELQLNISDDGTGFALKGNFDEHELREKGLTPWSIYERTKSLGGTVSLFSQPVGTHLQVSLPLPEAA